MALAGLIVGLLALIAAAYAVRESQRTPPKRWRELEGEARQLIADLDMVADKLTTKLARESKRRTREVMREREEPEQEEQQVEEAPGPGLLSKAQLMQLAARHPMLRGIAQ